jgi:alpha-1,2-mannosyltransferase
MAHFRQGFIWQGFIWKGLRSGGWLTAARARGYSLILLGLCIIAVAGWIAVSDGLIDRNGKRP